jgi:hypothetical protein
MRLKLFLISVILFFSLFGLVFTSPLPPMPECNITAEVLGLSDDSRTIIQLVYVEKEAIIDLDWEEDNFCQNEYFLGREMVLELREDYKKGAVIQGTISLHGDESGSWYFLEGVREVNNSGTSGLEEGKISETDLEITEDLITEDSNSSNKIISKNEKGILVYIYFFIGLVIIFLIIFMLKYFFFSKRE